MSQLHVVAGGDRLQMFLSKIIRSVVSKFAEDTEVGMTGYNLPHWACIETVEWSEPEGWPELCEGFLVHGYC